MRDVSTLPDLSDLADTPCYWCEGDPTPGELCGCDEVCPDCRTGAHGAGTSACPMEVA